MKKTIASGASAAGRRQGFRMRPVAAGCAVLLVGLADLALAQEQIVVTGIRAAVESAIATKKSADTIVEAISSEDIGKLPDPSVADSISRLPGVSAQRNKGSGKAEQISVRGMSPDFNGALLNGREVASSGDSRGVSFDLYPAELMGSVVIYKTPHAGLLGQGLSSTIDLRTLRPLNFKQRTVAVNYRQQRTGIKNGVPDGEGDGDRTSLSYVDQFMGGKLGVAIGYAKFTENGAVQPKVNTWGGWTPDLDFNGQKLKVPGGFGRDNEQTIQKREGLMAVLQYKPNKDFETVVDFFQSKGSSAYFKKGIEGFIGGGSGDGSYRTDPKLLAATAGAGGVAASGTVDSFKAVVRNHNEGTDDKLEAWGLNQRAKFGAWVLNGDAGQSKVTKTGARYETTAGLAGNGHKGGAMDTLSWTGFDGTNFADLQFKPGKDYSDPSIAKLTDVMGWGGGEGSPQAGYVASPSIVDKLTTARVSGKTDFAAGPLATLEVGINSSDRTKTSSTQEGFLVIAGSSDPYAAVTAPGAGKTTVAGIPVMTWDPRGSLGSIYSLRSNLYGTVINRNWSVNEKVITGYVKSDLDGKLFGLDYSGNVGAQVVHTDQSSRAFANDAAQCTGSTPETCRTLTGGKTYVDVLPSLNLSFDLKGDQLLRFGLGKTMARPKMGDMRASMDAPSVPNDNSLPVKMLRASGGNPELEPYRAWALDLSYEKYFGNKGAISVAGFYKDIDTYILTLGRSFDFKNNLTANTVLPPSGSTVGILSAPVNGTGGAIYGFEVGARLPLSLVTSALDGFGFDINYSNTRSNIPLQLTGIPNLAPTTIKIPLPGLSRQVTNLRFYYEKHGVQVAVAQRSRSDFLGEITDYKDDKEYTFIKGEKVIDLQVAYEFQSGFAKGLSLMFQANNVNNAKFQRYVDDPKTITSKDIYGRTYLFGLNYRL